MDKQQELRMRLDMLIPMNWMEEFIFNYNTIKTPYDKVVMDGKKNEILAKVVELNPVWVEEVITMEGWNNLGDILHDFRGIYSEDNHFLPRISVDTIKPYGDILYRVGDKVSVLMRGTKADSHQDAIISSIDTEDGVLRKTSKRDTLLSVYSEEEELEDEVSTYDIRFYGEFYMTDVMGSFDENGDAVDVKVNGYTNIQTYRLCLVLDNEQVVPNPLKRFLELVQEDEFEGSDIDIINWNEVIERYSDSILLEHSFYANK